MNSNDEKKQKICYLFLSLDEPMTEAHLLKFTKMGENFSGFTESKDGIIAECNRVIGKSIDSDDRYDVISEEIIKIADLLYIPGQFVKEKKQRLWMLETIAWYDGTCTVNEKKLIRALMRKWEIDPSVLVEMEDTAETLVALDNYRNWIQTKEPYLFVDSVVKALDKNQTEIGGHIAYTINLG
jgi:hypothetical protein